MRLHHGWALILALLLPAYGDRTTPVIVPPSSSPPVPLCVDQDAYLKASTPGNQDYFGQAVSASGDLIAVGAPHEGNMTPAAMYGATYLFRRIGASWQQVERLAASNPGHTDNFGCSVSVSGDLVVVGAFLEDSNGDPSDESIFNSGAAYVSP